MNNLHGSGARDEDIGICLVGGANVLKKEGDTIATTVIDSVKEIIEKNKLLILASSLGGFERRSAALNLKTGMVYYTIGESAEKKLWGFSGLPHQKNKK